MFNVLELVSCFSSLVCMQGVHSLIFSQNKVNLNKYDYRDHIQMVLEFLSVSHKEGTILALSFPSLRLSKSSSIMLGTSWQLFGSSGEEKPRTNGDPLSQFLLALCSWNCHFKGESNFADWEISIWVTSTPIIVNWILSPDPVRQNGNIWKRC